MTLHPMKLKRGLVHIYTGNGKGKTTAALGLGMRAFGHGFKVLVIQFMKGRINYGELSSAKKLGRGFSIFQVGRETFVDSHNPDSVDVELARKGLELAGKSIMSGVNDMVILDEILCAVMFRLLKEKDVIELVRAKPHRMELVLTGRGATTRLKKEADLVTNMREVKHYYANGVEGRMGIEW
jgi:cob(I)alamin adenosyltransferase